MRRYLLTPRGRIANLALVMLLAVAAVGVVPLALRNPVAWCYVVALGALVLGLLRHVPMTYVLIALVGMIGMAGSLNFGRGAAVLANLLAVVLALYARSQMLERVESRSP